jgi:tRNA1Val (adenine37-N6)-methyltransferase
LSAISNDTLFDGRLICSQHRHGYRFSVDAVLIAHFCRPVNQGRVLDLGCGCGVIGLILAHRWPKLQLTGLELQPALAQLARENVTANSFQDRFQVQEGDLCRINEHFRPESFDLVVSNPPYRKTGTGRINPKDECAIARHELTADMNALIRAAAFAVKNRGAVACIYPAERLATLTAAMMAQRLVPKRLQPVYSYPEDSRAGLIMLEAIKNGGEGLKLLPPLYIYQCKNRDYSPEISAMYNSN